VEHGADRCKGPNNIYVLRPSLPAAIFFSSSSPT
jgi:hypothetical protein